MQIEENVTMDCFIVWSLFIIFFLILRVMCCLWCHSFILKLNLPQLNYFGFKIMFRWGTWRSNTIFFSTHLVWDNKYAYILVVNKCAKCFFFKKIRYIDLFLDSTMFDGVLGFQFTIFFLHASYIGKKNAAFLLVNMCAIFFL